MSSANDDKKEQVSVEPSKVLSAIITWTGEVT